MKRLEWWFDFSCPYAYLSSVKVEALAAKVGAELDVRPMLLGGVFRAREVPQKLFQTLGEAKARHNANDLVRYANLFGVDYAMPAGHPFRTVEALRSLLVVGPPFLPLVHRFYRAYWVDGLDIGSRPVLEKVLSEAGHDASAVLEATQSDKIKADLRARTDEAINRGVFGAPAFFVDDELYWGQDRMGMVARAFGVEPYGYDAPRAEVSGDVDLFFDYSSPFSYLGVTRAEKLFGDRARWHPMLLGALFKAVGQDNIPMATMSDAKRAFVAKDLLRQANEIGTPFQWPTRFPMNSVLALRVTLLSGAHKSTETRRLVHDLYKAYWVEDRDIADPIVVSAVADGAGYNGADLVRRAREAKDLLFSETTQAVDAGVFGAPTVTIKHGDEPASLYFGSDRMEIAALAARGRDDLR